MGENSAIEWTDHTFNPWHGCQKVSPGCKNCYAETLSKRFGRDIWGPPATTSRKLMSKDYWLQPLKWNKAAESAGERKRVFCASMADVFEDHPQVAAERFRLFGLIDETPWLDWLLLTKRPENIGMAPWWAGMWPDNVWLGISVENQEEADRRIPILLDRPGVRVRFLSCEPLLGPVDIAQWLPCPRGGVETCGNQPGTCAECDGDRTSNNAINWVICGGESGHGARPMRPDWARSLRDQCVTADVAFHFKQWGEYMPLASADEADNYPAAALYEGEGYRAVRVGKHAAGRLLDGREWNEFPESRREALL